MSVRYNVQANVVDLRNDYPTDKDIFLVDTNVWYWQTYTKAGLSSSPYQTNHYPSYLLTALNNGSNLMYCGLSLSELAHQIEKTEREIFDCNIKTKEYRHNYPPQRQRMRSRLRLLLVALDNNLPVNCYKQEAI